MDDARDTTPAATPRKLYAFGPFVFDADSLILTREGEDAVLPPRIGSVLGCLLASAGSLVRKEEILLNTWGNVFVGDGALTHCISQLRQALGDSPRQPRFIQTVHRRGYRFIAAVERLDPDTRAGTATSRPRSGVPAQPPGPPAVESGAPSATASPGLGNSPAAVRRTRSPDRRLVSWAALLVATAGLMGWVATWGEGPPLELPEPARILTIPLESGAGAPAQDDGSVLFTQAPDGGLWRVHADGARRAVTTPDRAQGELRHQRAQALPDGRQALFTIWRGSPETSAIGVADLETGEYRPLIEDAYDPRFTVDGWLLWMRGDDLRAARFDVDRLQLLTEPRSLGLSVEVDADGGVARYAVSDDGDALAFIESTAQARRRPLGERSNGGEESAPAPESSVPRRGVHVVLHWRRLLTSPGLQPIGRAGFDRLNQAPEAPID